MAHDVNKLDIADLTDVANVFDSESKYTPVHKQTLFKFCKSVLKRPLHRLCNASFIHRCGSTRCLCVSALQHHDIKTLKPVLSSVERLAKHRILEDDVRK